jgi:regulator of protease activity HflC (stomatin/prohibitin superfamily)
MEAVMIREKVGRTIPGWAMVPVILAGIVFFIWRLTVVAPLEDGPTLEIVFYIAAAILTGLLSIGFFIVNPNQAKVLQLFGSYVGTVKSAGFHWANPLLTKKRISLRVRNFESAKIKVNDHEGNPIEIAAVVVWRVVDTAEAAFEVDDYDHYVKVQSEAALRNLATQYPYDTHLDGERSLRANTVEIADELKREVQERLAKAGVEVMEARITHLAYAPEIAAAMLQRQQAGAIIAARQRIVEGAVGMVEMALDLLSRREIVALDNERRAAMVSNLLVVLCGDRNTQPVINTGTIYQ